MNGAFHAFWSVSSQVNSKHFYNTGWAFSRKHDILTGEKITFSTVAFRRESEIIWYFIGVYILKRTLHDCLEILFTCWTKFLNTKRENSYLCAAAMWYPLSILMYWFKENLNSQLSQICQFRKNFLWKKCNAVWREISVE